jgi:hypothetical protein
MKDHDFSWVSSAFIRVKDFGLVSLGSGLSGLDGV